MLLSDRLIKRIIELKSPIVVGLDPVIGRIPSVFKAGVADTFEGAADCIVAFNRAIIDAVCDYVPAVKPQLAFYELYGFAGVRAFEMTAAYAKSKGLFVIADGKKNDIGNVASAYASAFLGEVPLLGGGPAPGPFGADFLTVSPFLGTESLTPFFETALNFDKGVFVLVRTSNAGSGTMQDAVTGEDNNSVSDYIAGVINEQSMRVKGEYGYSSIGAVVGATYPKAAAELRKRMPASLILVPGYGAQGASAAEILPNFNPDGLGAVVNASRSVIFAYESEFSTACSLAEFSASVEKAVQLMQREIYSALKSEYPKMIY